MRWCIQLILGVLNFLEKYLLFSGHFQYLSSVSLTAFMFILLHFTGIVMPTIDNEIKYLLKICGLERKNLQSLF